MGMCPLTVLENDSLESTCPQALGESVLCCFWGLAAAGIL